MIYKNLPYKEVWIKKSFLMGPDNFKWASDEYVQGQLVGVKAVQSSVPLFEVYLPEYAACYDKVLQCAIFEKPYTGDKEIRLDDVAWWDCISDNIDIYSKLILKGSPVAMKTRNGENRTGTYFFTLDFKPPPPNESIDYTEAQWWSEHKQKNFFFDDGVHGLVDRVVSLHEVGNDEDALLFCRCDEFVGLFDRKGHRLFNQNVFSGLDSGEGLGVM